MRFSACHMSTSYRGVTVTGVTGGCRKAPLSMELDYGQASMSLAQKNAQPARSALTQAFLVVKE